MFPFGIFCSSSTHTQHQDKKGKNVFEHRICIDINMAWLSDNRFEMCLYNRSEAIDLDNDIDTKSPRSIRHVCNIQPDFSIFTLWIYSLRTRRNAQRSRHHQTDTKNTWKPRNKHVIESRGLWYAILRSTRYKNRLQSDSITTIDVIFLLFSSIFHPIKRIPFVYFKMMINMRT